MREKALRKRERKRQRRQGGGGDNLAPTSSNDDEAGDDVFKQLLRAKSGELRRVAISEVSKSKNGHVKLRKLCKVVLERTFTQSERGAGSWKELARKEPQLIQTLCKVLKHSRKVKLKNGEAHLIHRRTEERKHKKESR